MRLKSSFLTLGILLLLSACLIVFAVIVRAETDIYATAKTSGMGYESGVGISASHLYRFKDHFAIGVNGALSNQKKTNADSGYTYSVSGHGRFYFSDFKYDNFYIAGGLGWSGYNSEFDHGSWSKSSWKPMVGCGYDSALFDAQLTYYPEETQTANKVESIGLTASLLLTERWILSARYSHAWYDQSGERDDDGIFTLALGWRF